MNSNRGQDEGFFLLDAIISSFLMIVMAGYMHFIHMNRISLEELQARLGAEMIAQSQVDGLLMDNACPGVDKHELNNIEYFVDYTVNASDQGQINVKIQWQGRQHIKSYVLSRRISMQRQYTDSRGFNNGAR